MKKIISSVLVFALMGLPMVSGAFADEAGQKKAVEQIIALLKEEVLNGNTEAAQKYQDVLSLLAESVKLEKAKKENLEINPKEPKEEVPTEKKHLDRVYDKELDSDEANKSEKSESSEEAKKEQKGMSTTKKVLLTVSIMAAIAGAGYAAYTYCPAVQEFVNGQAAKMGEVAGTAKGYIVDKAGVAKHFVVDKAGVAKHFVVDKAGVARDFVVDKAGIAKHFVVDKAGVARDFVVDKAGVAKNFVVDKAGVARDFVVDKAGVAKNFVVDKAGVAKHALGNAAGFIAKKGAIAKHALGNAANSAKTFIADKAGNISSMFSAVKGWFSRNPQPKN